MMMTEQNTQIPSMSMSWTTLAVIVVIGVFSLFSLWMGFQALSSDRPEQSTYYLLTGTVGFAAIGYMFFRTKAVTTRKSDIPKVDVVTILECPACELKRVRDFKPGDYIHKDDEPCTRCEDKMVITGIHRRAEPEKKPKQ
jgi:TRAP-type uncharacterized transport system fused permease subunit